MDDHTRNDVMVTRQSVVQMHTIAIEQGKRLAVVERHLRDIKAAVMSLVIAGFFVAVHQIWKQL